MRTHYALRMLRRDDKAWQVSNLTSYCLGCIFFFCKAKHSLWFLNFVTSHRYCCPICSKSIIDMSRTWKRIDEEVDLFNLSYLIYGCIWSAYFYKDLVMCWLCLPIVIILHNLKLCNNLLIVFFFILSDSSNRHAWGLPEQEGAYFSSLFTSNSLCYLSLLPIVLWM